MLVDIDGVTIPISSSFACEGISVSVPSGSILGIVGPNGSGKSTLLRSIYRVLHPTEGQVSSDGRNVWHMSPLQLAREMAVVVQEPEAEFDFVVSEVVMMGRAPHKGSFARETQEDRNIVDAALDRVGMAGNARRLFSTLSGGEKQRILIARALAQQARALVLDEPTNHLDLRYQFEILALIKGLGVTTIVAMHDLNLTALHCDSVLIMAGGRAVAAGSPSTVLEPTLLSDVFDIAVHAIEPEPGRRVFYFGLRSGHPV